MCTTAGFEGTVGGGALEARAMEAARQCRESGLSALVRCDLTGLGPDSDMICGGQMEVLCEVLTPEAAALFVLATAALREDKRGAWLVDVSEPSLPRRAVVAGGPAPGPRPAAARSGPCGRGPHAAGGLRPQARAW